MDPARSGWECPWRGASTLHRKFCRATEKGAGNLSCWQLSKSCFLGFILGLVIIWPEVDWISLSVQGGEEQLLSKLTACSHIEEHLFHLLQRINFSSPVAEHQQASINFSWSLSSISIDPFIGHQPFFLIILLPLKHQMKFKSPLISTGYFQNSTFCSASKS